MKWDTLGKRIGPGVRPGSSNGDGREGSSRLLILGRPKKGGNRAGGSTGRAVGGGGLVSG